MTRAVAADREVIVDTDNNHHRDEGTNKLDALRPQRNCRRDEHRVNIFRLLRTSRASTGRGGVVLLGAGGELL